jgi:hypothetical protein
LPAREPQSEGAAGILHCKTGAFAKLNRDRYD